MVRLSNLQPGKVLCCPHCRKSFTSNRSGALVEVIQRSNGRWVERGQDAAPGHAARWRRFRLVAASLALFLLIGGICWAATAGTSSSAPPAELPQELEPRAELFARAWLRGDYGTMRKLTDPAQDRLLFAWYKRSPAPALNQAETDPGDVRVALEVPAIRSASTSLQVRFPGLQAPRGAPPIGLRLSWQERGGNWFFQPAPGS
jgi:hypothetical protein